MEQGSKHHRFRVYAYKIAGLVLMLVSLCLPAVLQIGSGLRDAIVRLGIDPGSKDIGVPCWLSVFCVFNRRHVSFWSRMAMNQRAPWVPAVVVRKTQMDAMGSLMLVCAVAASLALGVLVAYGICQAMFRAFRLHAVVEAKTRASASVRIPLRG